MPDPWTRREKEAERIIDEAISKRRGSDGPLPELEEIRLRAFMETDQRIEYLIDDVFRRGWFYSLTGPTGHGKTGIAVPLALDVADNGDFCGNECNGGPVLYIASENPDDVRARFIVAMECARRWSNEVLDQVFVLDQTFVLAERLPSLVAAVERVRAVLVIVDTDQAIAMTSADDENSNAGRLEHAKRLRTITRCKTRPTVVDLCHPIKHVSSPDGCVPRGGGAFLNEVDGNFRIWRNGDMLELSSDPNKFRGRPVSMMFRIQAATTDKLKDTKGRLIEFPMMIGIAESEAQRMGKDQWTDGNRLLDAMASMPDGSMAEWAKACQWIDESDRPIKWKVQRLLTQLAADDPPLVKRRRGGRWSLTPAGLKESKKSA
jgi:AAA domain